MKLLNILLQLVLLAKSWNRLTAIIIHCNYFQTTHLPLGYLYVCFLSHVEEIENPKVTAVVGNHLKNKTDLDVKLLHSTKVKLDFIPQNLESFFPHLIGFFFYNTGIKSFSNGDLKPFPKMTYLMMQGSHIEDLPNEIFEFNSAINYLNFKKSKVKAIGTKVFTSIPNLKYVNLEDNICVSGKGENPTQIEILKSKMTECFRSKTDLESTSTMPTSVFRPTCKRCECPSLVSCLPTDCAPTKEKENEKLKKEIANSKLTMRQLHHKINNEPLNCQGQNVLPDKSNRQEVESLKQEVANLKLKVSQQEMTVKSFKDELAKKSAELKIETDNVAFCKQKLEGVTKTLSKVTAQLQNDEGNPLNAVRNFDKMNRDECLEALKISVSDKESCGKENEYLMSMKSEVNSLSLMCDVTAWGGYVSCNAVNFKCLSENQKVSVVKNRDQTAVDKTKINELIVLNQHALFLPEVDQVFPNLVKLTVINSHLTRLSSNALNLSDLKFLVLAANQITDIFVPDLINLQNLEDLDLSSNRIKKVKVGVLKSLSELKVLRLNGNEIEELDSDLFLNNLKLTSIFLHDNQLKYISAEILTPLTALNTIDLSDNVCVKNMYAQNSIRVLNNVFSNNCGKPTQLCCRFSRLSDKDVACRAVEFSFQNKNTKLSSVKSWEDCIADESLIDPRVVSRSNHKEVEDVTVLEIIDERVYYLPTNLADHFIQITKLFVINSKLKTFSKKDFSGLSFLSYIQLSGNELTSFEPELFNEIPGLQHLDISNNRLTEFPPKLFEKMTNLIFLNASNNELLKLEADLFPRRNSLEEIYFDRNSIDEIDPKIFRHLRNVKIIDFTDNPCIGLKFPDDVEMKELPSKAIFC